MCGNNSRNSEAAHNYLRRNPLTIKSNTDRWFILLWVFILIIWITGVFNVFNDFTKISLDSLYVNWNSSPIPIAQSITIKPIIALLSSLDEFLKIRTVIIGVGMSLNFTFLMISFLLGYYAPYYCCHIGVTSLFILLIVFSIQICASIFENRIITFFSIYEFRFIMTNILQIIYIILAFICMSKVGIRHVPKIIRDTSRVYFRFPLLVLFGICIYSFAAVVILFSLASMRTAKFEGFWSNIIFIEGYYLVYSMHYFGVAVISKVTAAWNYTENKSKNSNALVFQCIVSVTRHQFGTIAFGATGIGPLIAICLNLCCYKRINIESKTIFDRIVGIPLSLYLIFDITKYSLMVNSIHGEEFKNCIKKVLRILTQTNSKTFSFLWVFHGIVNTVSMLLVILPLGVTLMWAKEDAEQIYLIYSMVTASVIILTLPLYLIVDSTGLTNYIYAIENDEIMNDLNGEVHTIPLRAVTMS